MNEIAKRKFTLDDIEAGYLCDTVHCGYITGLMHKYIILQTIISLSSSPLSVKVQSELQNIDSTIARD